MMGGFPTGQRTAMSLLVCSPIRAGLIGCAPALGKFRPQPFEAGEIRFHPERQLVAAARRKHAAEQHGVQIIGNCCGRSGIPRIARERFIQ